MTSESEATATQAAGSDNPQSARTCRLCKDTVIVSPETWVYRKRNGEFRAEGTICHKCNAARKMRYKRAAKQIAEQVNAVTVAPKDSTPEGAKKALEKARKIDVAQALKAGSIALNQAAPHVLAKILEWADDEGHEDHRWAIQFLAERVVPRKLYEALGGEAAGVGAVGAQRPMFVFQVTPAGAKAGGNTYDEHGNLILPTQRPTEE